MICDIQLVASNRSYFRNCCEVKEDDIVDLLKMIKGMKSISLSGGSDLVFYTQDGKKIETEQEKIEQQEEVKQAVKSTIQKSRHCIIYFIIQVILKQQDYGICNEKD